MIKEIYKVDYQGVSSWSQWVVIGPGTYIPCGANRHVACEQASRLNNAYILGYTKVMEIEETENEILA